MNYGVSTSSKICVLLLAKLVTSPIHPSFLNIGLSCPVCFLQSKSRICRQMQYWNNIHVKGNKIPYITSELKSIIRQRDYLRAKANKTSSCILRQAYKQMRTKVNQKLYLLRKNYYANRIEQHKDDLKTT